jgi:hypothetical protein
MTLRAEHDSLIGYLESVLTPEQLSRPLLTNFNHWNFAQGSLSEIALTLLKNGSDVTIAFWADKTPMLDVAWETSRKIGTLLLSPTREQQIEKALKRAGLQNQSFAKPPINRWQPHEEIVLPKVMNRSSIRAMRYRGADMGRAILQVHPDGDTPMTDEFMWPGKWVDLAAKSFAYVFDQVTELIKRLDITVVALYNGRFLHDRAVAAAAQRLRIPLLNYDLGGNQTNFDLTIDDTHDWEALQRRMLSLYERWDPAERDALGSSWFLERTQHIDPTNARFVEAQKIGSMIELPKDKKIVVYFSSSGDEIIELDLNWDAYFGGQENALRLLSKICSEDPNIFLVVRSHPHKRHKPTNDVKEWLAAVEEASPDIHLDPHSDVDSYALMRRADVVVTYGSTSGIEAAFAGKPVAVMGPSAYNILGAASSVTNEDELRSVIEDPQPGNLAGAVSYGLLCHRRGFNYSEVNISMGETFTIAGRVIYPSKNHVKNPSHAFKKIRTRRLISKKFS